MNDNWVVSTLESALSGWNDKLASFAGEATSRTGQTFLRSYVGVCMP